LFPKRHARAVISDNLLSPERFDAAILRKNFKEDTPR
jgi:hypothetical protein